MKKFLLHTFKYGLLLFVLLNIISWLSLYSLRNSSFYKPEFLTNEVKSTKFDYIIIGSSIGLTSLNTESIDSLTNKKGLNLSIDDTATSSNYLMLQHYYKQGKKADYCIFAVSYWDVSIQNPKLNDNDYRFLPYITEDYVYQYYNSLELGFFKPLTISYYFPIFGVGYYNTEIFYPSLISTVKPYYKNRFDKKGNYFYPNLSVWQQNENELINVRFNNPYINKIKKLCDENKTKLIIYQAPQFNRSLLFKTNEYVIINHSNKLKDASNFYNSIHLNKMGRKKASSIFVDEFKNY